MKKIIRYIITVALVLCVFCGLLVVNSSAVYTIDHTAEEGIEYISHETGLHWCYQYANQYIKYLCGEYIYAENPMALMNGSVDISEFPFDLIPNADAQKGDLILWANSSDGHIAILVDEYTWWDSNYNGDKEMKMNIIRIVALLEIIGEF